jgi:uncharacterized protein
MEHYLFLIIFGLLIGLLGTLIGAGGGFILTPVLLILYPADSPEIITSISLAVTFANSFSGSFAYGRMKRINYRYGLIFAAGSVPGAVIGALTTQFVPRPIFDLLFSIILVSVSIYIFIKPPAELVWKEDGETRLSGRKTMQGIIISFFVGVMSSFLGIGGGIIHVPLLAGFLGFPIHIATATSHFILAFVTFAGLIVHIMTGTFHHGVRRAIALSIGVIIGAQFGARLSKRIQGKKIIRILAVALFVVSIRLALLYFQN